MSQHILVTGGAGFIGSHLVDRLLADGHRVTVVDNFDAFYDPAIKRANIAAHLGNPAYRLVECDIRDGEGLRDALSGQVIDVIVHLAARAGVRPSIAEPVLYQDVNVAGTQQMLELARSFGVRQFVFASSSSVYGVNPNVPWREDDPVLMPISPYAATKVAGELLGHVYAHLYGIRFLALRFFTVYGPRQRPDLAIHKFTQLVRQGRQIPFFGDGGTRRDYTFVDDVVAGIVGAIAYDGSLFEIVNLGNNRTVSLTELVDAIGTATGTTPVLDHQPMQPGDVPQTWAAVEKGQRLFGYRPTTTIAEGLKRFVAWVDEREGAVVPTDATPATPAFAVDQRAVVSATA